MFDKSFFSSYLSKIPNIPMIVIFVVFEAFIRSHQLFLVSLILSSQKGLTFAVMSGATSATQRLQPKRQILDEAYAPPANFLEIEVVNPITHGVGKMRYTDYEIRLRVS